MDVSVRRVRECCVLCVVREDRCGTFRLVCVLSCVWLRLWMLFAFVISSHDSTRLLHGPCPPRACRDWPFLSFAFNAICTR